MAFAIMGFPSPQPFAMGMGGAMMPAMMPGMGMGVPFGFGGFDQFQASPMMLMLQMFQMSMMMNFMAAMSQYQQMGQNPGFAGYPGMAFPGGGMPGFGGGMPMNPFCGCPPTPAWPAMAGNQASRAVQIAQSQVGVCGGNPQVCQYTRGRSEPWCADFVSWCYERSGRGSPFGHQPGVPGIRRWGEQNGLYHDRGTYRPRAGDVIIFGRNQHTGIVERVDPDGTIHTIEGNTNGYGYRGGRSSQQGACARHALSGNSAWITGYVDMQRYQ